MLLLTDPIDPFVIPALPEYKGKPLKAADRNQPELDADEKKQAEEDAGSFQPLLASLKGKLDGVKDLRLTRRLRESASCLTAGDDALDPHMERLLAKMGQGGMGPQERILELNPEHPVVQGLLELYRKDPADPRVEGHAHLLHDQALLAEGSRLADPSAFVKRLNELLVKDATR